MKQHDNSEAMRLADYARGDEYQRAADDAVDLLRKQSARIAELEAERDEHQSTATALIALLADIRKACGDNGTRMQPELVEFIGAMSTERDQLRAEVERMDFIEKEFGDVLLLELAKDLPRADMPFREAIDLARTTHKETE